MKIILELQKLSVMLALLVSTYSVHSANSFKLQPLPFTNFTKLQLSGQIGSNFIVQVSSNLAGWQNLWFDSFQSNTYLFVDMQTAPSSTRFYRGVLTNSPIKLQLTQSNSVAQVNPMTLVQVGVTGLTPNIPVFVQFYTSNGIVANVPPVQISSSNLIVTVPPLLTQNDVITNSLLSARIVQYLGSQAIMSAPFSTISVQSTPVSRVLPGKLTLNLLQGAFAQATNLLQAIPGSSFGTSNNLASLSNVISSLQILITNIQTAVSNPGFIFSIGTISGQPIVVGQEDLQACDNLLVANLLALDSLSLTNSSSIRPLDSCDLWQNSDAVAQAAIANGQLPPPQQTGAMQNATCLSNGSQISLAALFQDIFAVYGQSHYTLAKAESVTPSTDPKNSLFSAVSGYISGLFASGVAYAQLAQTNIIATQLLQSTIQQTENLTYGYYTGAVSNVTGAIAAASQNMHALILAFANTPVAASVPSFTVNLTTTGPGTVTPSPPGPFYTNGTVVTLTAVPNAGAVNVLCVFSGDASGINTATVTVNANKSVTATFLTYTNEMFSGSYSGTQDYSGDTDTAYCHYIVSFSGTMTLEYLSISNGAYQWYDSYGTNTIIYTTIYSPPQESCSISPDIELSSTDIQGDQTNIDGTIYAGAFFWMNWQGTRNGNKITCSVAAPGYAWTGSGEDGIPAAIITIPSFILTKQ